MVLGNSVSGYEVKNEVKDLKTTALSIKLKIFLKWKRTKESHFHDNSIWQFARTISLEFKMMPKPSGGLISPNLLPQLRSSPSPRYKSKIKIIFKFLQSLSLSPVELQIIHRFSQLRRRHLLLYRSFFSWLKCQCNKGRGNSLAYIDS